jgi:hypothetical protein
VSLTDIVDRRRAEPWSSCDDAPAEVGACCDHMHTKPGKVCARCGTPHWRRQDWDGQPTGNVMPLRRC